MGQHRRLLTREEAWQRLNVSESTLDRWRKSGIIRAVPLGTRTVRFDPDLIESYIREGTRGTSRQVA